MGKEALRSPNQRGIGVSAAGLQGKGSQERSVVFSQTPVVTPRFKSLRGWGLAGTEL